MVDYAWLTARPIAHRGYHDASRAILENSISAFARAADAGFSIECDLQFAADGVPVVFHDDTLDRLCGVTGNIRARLSSDLRQTALGGTKDRIPTFADVLAFIDGRVPIIAEMKGRPGDDDGFAGAVMDIAETYGGPLALMSFDHDLLRDIKALDPSLPVGLTAEGTRPQHFSRHEDAMALGLDFVSYNVHHLPNAFTESLRRQGLCVITWTVRNSAQRETSFTHGDQMTFEGFDPRSM